MVGSDVNVRTATREQDAVRILFLINAAGTPPNTDLDEDVVAVMIGQARLQALDFWLRNPDYLADELLNEYGGGRMDRGALTLAGQILESAEPDLRCFPMIRWLFGAFEPLDDALSVLRCAGLIKVRRTGNPSHIARHDYLLLKQGREAVCKLLVMAPALNWYAGRASLVASVAGDRGGRALKDRQYEQAEYASTELGTRIGSIADRVRRRLQELIEHE